MWYWAEAEPQTADELKGKSNAKLVMRVHWRNFEGPQPAMGFIGNDMTSLEADKQPNQ